MDDWRIRLILGAVAAVIVGTIAYGLITGEEVIEPSASDKRLSAVAACHDWVADRVDPLDVDFREPAKASVTIDNGNRYRVTDRAAIGGDLVVYECRTTRSADGDWTLDAIRLP